MLSYYYFFFFTYLSHFFFGCNLKSYELYIGCWIVQLLHDVVIFIFLNLCRNNNPGTLCLWRDLSRNTRSNKAYLKKWQQCCLFFVPFNHAWPIKKIEMGKTIIRCHCCAQSLHSEKGLLGNHLHTLAELRNLVLTTSRYDFFVN